MESLLLNSLCLLVQRIYFKASEKAISIHQNIARLLYLLEGKISFRIGRQVPRPAKAG
jgi:hypothetical protein